MRAPKRVTILGNDEKEYKFLVKGGEDRRLDQRIQQVRIDAVMHGFNEGCFGLMTAR